MQKETAHECQVCGTALKGTLGMLFRLFGIRASKQNPNVCNRCDGHMQEGSVIELTVMFADLAGFTEMSNRIGPDRSFEVVDTFFKMANGVLIRSDAFIDKYIGDAVMAIFNAPIRTAKHADRAISAALGIQQGMHTVSNALGMDLQARIGIATGYARVGRLGSTDRKDYTVIGDVVNLASRLEALAMPGEVVVDGNAFAQVAENFTAMAAESTAIKGFSEPVDVYRFNRSMHSASIPLSTNDSLTTRKRVGLGAVLFAILGAPCAAMVTLSPLAVLLGAGALMAAIEPILHTLDSPQIRIPLQLFAVLGALANLYIVKRSYIQRRENNALGLTIREKGKLNFIAGLSVIVLLAVSYENYIHMVVAGKSFFQ